MTIPAIERRVRASFPFIRFIQANLPLPVAHGLLKLGMAHARLDYGVTRETVSAGGVRCEWIIPQTSPTNKALIYLHGGGFVYGLTPPHLQMGAYLAQKMGTRILMVDYRVAPEYPFPAALDDCVSVYR